MAEPGPSRDNRVATAAWWSLSRAHHSIIGYQRNKDLTSAPQDFPQPPEDGVVFSRGRRSQRPAEVRQNLTVDLVRLRHSACRQGELTNARTGNQRHFASAGMQECDECLGRRARWFAHKVYVPSNPSGCGDELLERAPDIRNPHARVVPIVGCCCQIWMVVMKPEVLFPDFGSLGTSSESNLIGGISLEVIPM